MRLSFNFEISRDKSKEMITAVVTGLAGVIGGIWASKTSKRGCGSSADSCEPLSGSPTPDDDAWSDAWSPDDCPLCKSLRPNSDRTDSSSVSDGCVEGPSAGEE